MRWPLREALLALREKLCERAREDYRHEVLVWSTLAATGASKSKKAPEPPTILKG